MQALQQSANTNPSIAWESSRLAIKLHEQIKAIAELRTGCRKRRLNVNGLARIAKLKEFEDVVDEDTYLDRLQVVGNDTISLSVYVNQVQRQAAIFEIVALEHWANYTTKPIFVEYHGPRYAIFDASKDCMRGIDKPKQRSVYESCDQEGYRDPNLDDWRPVVGLSNDEEIKARTKPSVVRVADYNVIYCMYKNITIDDKDYFCPPRPFKLSRRVPFKLMNTTYVANTAHIHQRDQNDDIKAISVVNITDIEYERESQMFISLKESQDRSVAAGELNYDKETLTVPAKILKWIVGGSLGTLASVITIIGCIWNCASKQSAGTDASKKEETHSEQININIAPAPEPAEHHGHRNDYSELSHNDGGSTYRHAHHRQDFGHLVSEYNAARLAQIGRYNSPQIAEQNVLALMNTLAQNMMTPGMLPPRIQNNRPGGVLPPRPIRPPPALPIRNSGATQSIA